MNHPQRLHPSAGIAIGPILFVLAMLALLATVMATGSSDFQVSGGTDRISNDIATQANLIRNTINNCNMQYTLAVSMGSVASSTDPYPCSNTSTGTDVSLLTCTPVIASPLCPPAATMPIDGTSLWNNTTSNILLPPPTRGFSPWTYINASATQGGRCFWTAPLASSPSTDTTIVEGLKRAASKFNSSATVTASNEVVYSPVAASQKFVVWITTPTGTPDSHCVP